MTSVSPPAGFRLDQLHTWSALPWDALAKVLALATALVPVTGAVQRIISYWASGRVPPSLGAAASVSELALAGASTLGSALLALIAAGILGSVFFSVLGSGESDAEAATRTEEAATGTEKGATTEDEASPIDQDRPTTDETEPDNPTSRRRTMLVWAVGILIVGATLLLPAWFALAMASIAGFLLLIGYLLTLPRPISIRRLLPAAVILTLGTGLLSGLSPRSNIAQTIDVDLAPMSGVPDGRYSLIGSDDDALYLLECRPDSQVRWVREANVRSLSYQPTEDLEITYGDVWDVISGKKELPEWTPFWQTLFGGQSWGLGFVQAC